MERVLSLEDKIRRAEEIYYRRRNQSISQKTVAYENQASLKQKWVKKLTIQTLVSVCIFTGLFMFLNNNTYSEIVKNKTNEILSYNIDFKNLYTQFLNKENTRIEEIESSDLAEEQSQVIETQEETLSIEENILTEEASSLNQMGEDATYIKQNISMIKPLTGTITSRYGLRENVEPLYHTGIDIAANTGTVIIAAMEGTAEVVSTEGSYGKHIKITNGEVSTLYAHCNNIYIKQGDYINQGQQIAEVGSTGNATGPHLHFEIIRNNQFIDPDLILDF